MSYCLNPSCPHPRNPDNVKNCRACGASMLMRDRYLGVKSLGQGGFGATFLSIDTGLPGNPCCVIKQLRPTSTDPNVFQMAKELFEREAQTLGRIGNHPQVPRLLDYFEYNKDFYLVQEFVSGNNLQQEIKRNGPISEAGAKQFLSEILPMIQYIHSQQVIHRDIKPANLIRRDQDKKLVLIDFGAVKNQVNPQTSTSAADQTALTSFAIGTPGFAPPEQMALRPVYASDIYAVGVTCIYLLTAKSPKDLDYNPQTGEMVWQKYVNISDNFAKVLKRMLEVSVRHRYQSADDVLRALDMEPYMDSLAQGLISSPTSKDDGLPSSGNPSGNPDQMPASGGATSATQRLAMAIRAKRARRDQSDGRTHAGTASSQINRNPLSSRRGGTSNTQSSRRRTGKLDAKTVVNSYVKGRRDFAQQNLSLLHLQDVNLSGCVFHQSKLMKVNLQGANLSNTNFGRANLSNASLRDANLGRAYLSYANLEGADLRGADLSFASLTYASLKGTNLCGANLTNAKISEDQLAQAKTNWTTILPSGRRGFW
ncbi:MAG: protein kinase domain-containing protein [Spirulinaceae cyanobacterium]